MNGSAGKTRTSFIVRLLATALVMSTVFVLTGASSARALPLEQAEVTQVIDYLNPLLVDFWSKSMASSGETYPVANGIVYYNVSGQNPTVDTGCGEPATPGIGGAHCSDDHNVYIDYDGMQQLIDEQGAYAGGALFVHEIAHHLQTTWTVTGMEYVKPVAELHADCLTGIFSRWAYDNGHISWEDALDGVDFMRWGGDKDPVTGEYLTIETYAGHGTQDDRVRAYDLGWTAYDFASCRDVTVTTVDGEVRAADAVLPAVPDQSLDLDSLFAPIVFTPTTPTTDVTDLFGDGGINFVSAPTSSVSVEDIFRTDWITFNGSSIG